MNTQFIEATDNQNYGKFLVAQFDAEEGQTESLLPGYEGVSIFYQAGARRLRPDSYFVIDLQTGGGCSLFLNSGVDAVWELHDRHPGMRRCPLFEPFLRWLGDQDLSGGVTSLARFVEISDG